VVHVELDHVPLGPVQPQRLAGVRIDFHRGDMSEARLLEAQRLTAGASADLQTGQPRHHDDPLSDHAASSVARGSTEH